VNTVAEYLDAMGFELSVSVVPAGTARDRAQQWKKLDTVTRQPVSWPDRESLLAASVVETATRICVGARQPALISYHRDDYAISR
jgi:hypothetical protein